MAVFNGSLIILKDESRGLLRGTVRHTERILLPVKITGRGQTRETTTHISHMPLPSRPTSIYRRSAEKKKVWACFVRGVLDDLQSRRPRLLMFIELTRTIPAVKPHYLFQSWSSPLNLAHGWIRRFLSSQDSRLIRQSPPQVWFGLLFCHWLMKVMTSTPNSKQNSKQLQCLRCEYMFIVPKKKIKCVWSTIRGTSIALTETASREHLLLKWRS